MKCWHPSTVTHSTNVPGEACKQHNRSWMTPKRAALCGEHPTRTLFWNWSRSEQKTPPDELPSALWREAHHTCTTAPSIQTCATSKQLGSCQSEVDIAICKVRFDVASAHGTWGLWLKEFSALGNQISFFFFFHQSKKRRHAQTVSYCISFLPPLTEGKQTVCQPLCQKKNLDLSMQCLLRNPWCSLDSSRSRFQKTHRTRIYSCSYVTLCTWSVSLTRITQYCNFRHV